MRQNDDKRRAGAATIAAAGRKRCCRRLTTRRDRWPGATKWEGSTSVRSGLLSTAGNLLFAGDSANNFVAFDAKNGTPLWHAGLHTSITNGPITYALDGIQYVVVAANDSLYAFVKKRCPASAGPPV